MGRTKGSHHKRSARKFQSRAQDLQDQLESATLAAANAERVAADCQGWIDARQEQIAAFLECSEDSRKQVGDALERLEKLAAEWRWEFSAVDFSGDWLNQIIAERGEYKNQVTQRDHEIERLEDEIKELRSELVKVRHAQADKPPRWLRRIERGLGPLVDKETTIKVANRSLRWAREWREKNARFGNGEEETAPEGETDPQVGGQQEEADSSSVGAGSAAMA